MGVLLETPRLLLRDWLPSDSEPFARMNADPRVMAHYPICLAREESDALIARFEIAIAERGFGFQAVELRETGEFIGFTGLGVPRFETGFNPCVEIAWRIASGHWNRGYATEAARAAAGYGFDRMELGEIYAFTVPPNLASRKVMEKLGMQRVQALDFLHPLLPCDHPLRLHLVYRLKRPLRVKTG
jgi:RimJ/RimL family protein N-acetyltransferase